MKYGDTGMERVAAYAGAGGAPGYPEEHTAESLADQEMVMQAEGDTLHVHGDIDLYQAGLFRQAAEAHIRNATQPRLDLTRVPFLDSAGLAALLALSREAKAQGKTLRVAIAGSPRRVLRITGIDRMLALEG
jgi:anti-sigma B factor antagonist